MFTGVHHTALITRDLEAERLSHERAALLMRKLNKRGKGGWLARSLGKLLR